MCAVAVDKEGWCFADGHVEVGGCEAWRESSWVVEVFDDLKFATVVEFAGHELGIGFGQLMVDGGAGLFATTVYEEEFPTWSQGGCNGVQKGIEAFGWHVGDPEAEADSIVCSRGLPRKEVGLDVRNAFACYFSAVDGHHFGGGVDDRDRVCGADEALGPDAGASS